jgi:4-hydroxybenzoate polyprenyltransferase
VSQGDHQTGGTLAETPRRNTVGRTSLALLRAIRPAQWIKNFFVLVPLAFTPALWSTRHFLTAAAAFGAFCLATGAAYVWNDWLDLENDRRHPRKSHRPLAAGEISPPTALSLAAVLVVVALAGASRLGRDVLLVLSVYLALQFLYSIILKRVVILDVMIVALGFLLRVFAGGFALDIPLSRWLIVTTSFLALFLGFTKRRQEIFQLKGDSTQHRPVLGEYNLVFIDQINALLAGSCIVCYALYTVEPETISHFGTESLIATLPFVVYGFLRYLYLVHVRNLGDNPTEVVLHDRPLQLCIALWLVSFLWIIRS